MKRKEGQLGQSECSDVYSLGLVLLEACTLAFEANYYCKDFSVDKQVIQAKLSEMNEHYSNGFMEIVIRMLTIDPANRITVYAHY